MGSDAKLSGQRTRLLARATLVEAVRKRFAVLSQVMNEKVRRLAAASEAKTLGPRSISAVAVATGVSRKTIAKAVAELNSPSDLPPGRVRRVGGGAKRLVDNDPTLLSDLDALVGPTTRGDPMTPLRWTLKSVRVLAAELNRMGHKISPRSVGNLLKVMNYSLQSNRKRHEGGDHPDRDQQFQHISDKAQEFIAAGDPTVSVDTKKKELIGEFKNAGQEWRPSGLPREVNVYDFLSVAVGKAIPHGLYDIANNEGWVTVGIDHDTAAFAVASIRKWWTEVGKQRYPEAQRILVTADCGGSNGYRTRLWKTELQKLADEFCLPISVCHFPPGTSKWNKIEHSLFSFITINWRGKPLVDFQTIVHLIGSTKTSKGLCVRCELDINSYPTGIQVSDEEMASLNLIRDSFHGEWNYTIAPRNHGK